ncbi:hypothetical protein BS47DRAFT_1370315 [Hydnum rufescens UP504]|uniref:ATP-dependent RNA helicase n=1 Tax=Hydnum rufescens UP504 TaxID=1448309 RepID=A0A9P6E0N9_9AGAM|nr:hypothetical protein BS47DRAFT_1370315 [Hydnum rufescens UP504]
MEALPSTVPTRQESLAYLPSFPLPSQPAPPSASVLYLQGLDQALIEAEIVDPSQVRKLTMGQERDSLGLSFKTRQRLAQLGISELFAVQTALLPFLLPSSPFSSGLYLPHGPPRDVCVSAPTGSGKTLAYVLPILEVLSSRIVTRLRALVVLPTRDLVSQVRETFDVVCKGRGLKIGIATGQHSFAQEQAQLVGESSHRLEGGQSKVDILICTPGRLMDHLHGTPNFTLQHLRFLIIDEADRLVTQTFQDWLAQVLAATQPSPIPPTPMSHRRYRKSHSMTHYLLHGSHSLVLFRRLERTSKKRRNHHARSSCSPATLTRDPSKIAALNLRNTKYFVVGDEGQIRGGDGVDGVVGEAFAFPESLKEHMIVCDTVRKPLMLLYLIHVHFVVFKLSEANLGAGGKPQPVVAHAYSSDLSGGERKAILEKFRNADIGILVCSDLISRGIDISHVSHVVSYDSPLDMRKYVHRVGRTARAGRAGDAWSLVEEQEARYFKQMLSGANHLNQVTKMKVSEKILVPFMSHYNFALGQLKEVYGRQP